jgi:hypothetical protein
LLVVLSLAVVATVPLARATAPVRIPSADCCAAAANSNADHHCAKHAPKSAPDRQCCASCSLVLALYAPALRVSAPASPDVESFRTHAVRAEARGEGPPVPPPRFAIA